MKPYQGCKTGSVTPVCLEEIWPHSAKVVQPQHSKQSVPLKNWLWSLEKGNSGDHREAEVRLPIVYSASSHCTHLTPK